MTVDDFIELYEQFYRQVTLNNSYEHSRNSQDVKAITKFLERVEKDYKGQLDVSWLIFYLEKQFSHYADTVTPFGKGIPLVGWVVGNKAYQRFKDNSLVKNTFRFKKKIQLKIDLTKITSVKIKQSSKQDELFIALNEFEEIEKKVFLNEDEGLLWCYNNTTLYNHKSPICISCNFKEKCKQLLHTKLPRLYRIRGYE